MLVDGMCGCSSFVVGEVSKRMFVVVVGDRSHSSSSCGGMVTMAVVGIVGVDVVGLKLFVVGVLICRLVWLL